MNFIDNIPVDLFNLLIFTMPGFFFVRAFSNKQRSDFEYLMFSMFWGILLLVFFYHILPIEKFTPILQNPYSGAIALSMCGYVLGWAIKFFKSMFA